MIRIEYPPHDFRLKNEGGRGFIFDEWRRIWVRLTPEEWVRQNFLNYLVRVKGYPAALIAVEKEIQFGELKKRFDILVYDRNHQPWMLVECKAEGVELGEKVLEQALRYGITVPASYLVIVNDKECWGWRKGQGHLEELQAIPDHAG